MSPNIHFHIEDAVEGTISRNSQVLHKVALVFAVGWGFFALDFPAGLMIQ